jgi:hypothetical protein
MSLNFHYAAHTYVDNWVVCDREARKVLGFGRGTTPTDKEACEQLMKVANIYSIARNFRKEEVRCVRLSPVWTALQEISEPASHQDAKECVDKLIASLKPTYGRGLLSAAPKFLWMRFGRPIIIYDALTWNWIRNQREYSKIKTYIEFYDAWRKEFDDHHKEIDTACEELLNANIMKFLRPSECPSEEEKNEFEQAVKSQWFAERVFDFAIVNDESQSHNLTKV